MHVANEDGSYNATDEVVDAKWLLQHRVARTRVEGLARSIAGKWDDSLARLGHQKYWVGGVVPHQLFIMEKLLHHAMAASDTPYLRDRFLQWVLSDPTEQDTLLPDWLVEDAALQSIAFREAANGN